MAVEHDRRLSSAVGSVLQPMLKQPYVSPRPASRVGTSSDAAKYLRRNRGSSSLWLVKRCASIDLEDHDDDDDDGSLTVRGSQTARGPRLSGSAASEIFRRSRGSVGVLLDERNQADYQSPRQQPRLPSSEADANARRRAGLFEQPAESDERPPSRPRRAGIMSAEAEANAARGASGTMNALLKTVDEPRLSSDSKAASRTKTELSLCLDETSTGGTPRPQQRVKPEAEEIARKSSGKTCAAALAGRLAGDPVCVVRATGVGRDNCEASRSGSVGALFSTHCQQSATAGARSPPDSFLDGPGKEIAKHGKTGTLCYLMNNYGQLPRSPRPASRLRSEGKRYGYRNSGNNMAKCLNQAARARPGRRSRSAANSRKTA